MFSVGFLSLYIVFASASVAYAWRINTRKGLSSEMRLDFIKRHFFYVSCYVATWIPYLGFSYFVLYTTTLMDNNLQYDDLAKDPRFSDQLSNWFNAYNFACILTGLLMSFVRMREPIFKRRIYYLIYQYFGEIYGEDKPEKMDSTLMSFLMSSLNIELVHIILTTVSKNTVGTPKSDDYKRYQEYDHKS